MQIYLIRHADPNYAIDSLTPHGITEAKALGKHLAKQSIDRLYSSPLGRAKKTAQYIGKQTGLKATIQEWTRELAPHRLQGSNEVHWNIPGEDVRKTSYLNAPENWRKIPSLKDFPLDAQLANVTKNSDIFLASLGFVRENGVYRITRSNQEKIVMVCHGGFGLTWLAHLLAIPYPLMWTGFFLHTSSITTILFEERSSGIAVPRCTGLSDLSHLNIEGISPSNSGFTANIV